MVLDLPEDEEQISVASAAAPEQQGSLQAQPTGGAIYDDGLASEVHGCKIEAFLELISGNLQGQNQPWYSITSMTEKGSLGALGGGLGFGRQDHG